MDISNKPLLSCGCTAMALKKMKDGSDIWWCVVHDCGEQVPKPDLTRRKARCAYYGKPVKISAYNGNCCNICKGGDICRCEKDSNLNLWFFQYKPDKPYDEYYCACHGCD